MHTFQFQSCPLSTHTIHTPARQSLAPTHSCPSAGSHSSKQGSYQSDDGLLLGGSCGGDSDYDYSLLLYLAAVCIHLIVLQTNECRENTHV